MRSARLFLRLAMQGFARRPWRGVVLALAIAVGSGAVFASAVLRRAFTDSMAISLNRLGADFLVVPRETTVNLTAALLTVEPSTAVLDSGATARLVTHPAVAIAAGQRYHALPAAAAGPESATVDLIAFDPATDFTVIPWLDERLDRPLERGDLIVGGRHAESPGNRMALFGQTYTVYGRLAQTGVGPFERGIFASFETVGDIARTARHATGRDVLDAVPGQFSALLVRLRPDAAPDQFRFAAARESDVQIIAGNGLDTSVRQGLATLLRGMAVFTGLTVLATALLVGAVYSGLIAERRHELGLLLAVGMRPVQVVRLILAEAVLATGLGGTCGVLIGVAVLFSIRRSLGFVFEAQRIPFALPDAFALAAIGAVSVALYCGIGLIGSMVPAWRVSRSEPYALIRREGP